jgi:multidrug resistance efflux pump
VADVAVKESQKVEKGQVLLTLDQEPFRIAPAGAEANLGIVPNRLVTMMGVVLVALPLIFLLRCAPRHSRARR